MTEKARPAGRWLSLFKVVGWENRQIRSPIGRELMTSPLLDEVVDARLPGKVSKLQVTRDRTPNRHRWSGREYQGA